MNDKFWEDVAYIFAEACRAMPEYAVMKSWSNRIKTLSWLGDVKYINSFGYADGEDKVKYTLTEKGFLLMSRQSYG